MNYDLLMNQEISSLTEPKTLLLHACCAPCSSVCLKRLGQYFKITILFYNPNITEEEEYLKRLTEIKRFIKQLKVKYEINIIEAKYDPDTFFNLTKGMENIPERGSRCYKCYKLRLKETLKIAEENNFDYFTTTLTLSPYKNTNWLNEIGEDISKSSPVKFLNSDFKKHNGYKESIELSKKYNLYRQNYCGCIYSKRASDIKKESA